MHFRRLLKPQMIPTKRVHQNIMPRMHRYFSTSSSITPPEDMSALRTLNENDRSLQYFTPERIRNFFVCAHIDHGKSTLSDRLMEVCGNIKLIGDRRSDGQVLDKLSVERERGITVKAQSVSMVRKIGNETYLLNLIDTPGHVDFQYEVSRSLAACQGALLLVDASEGVQAQTVSNFRLAKQAELDIIPVLSKCDQPHADRYKVMEEMEQVFDVDFDTVLHTSAKTGEGIDKLFPAIVERIKPPMIRQTGVIPQSLIFDCWFDTTPRGRGVVCLVIVQQGELKHGDTICLYHATERASEDTAVKWDTHMYEIQELGVLTPELLPLKHLSVGQVGYVMANIRDSNAVRAGETMFVANREIDNEHGNEKLRKGKITVDALRDVKSKVEPAPGFEEAQHKVYSGVFPSSNSDFSHLEISLSKLFLSDTSVSCIPEQSHSLGQGFRLGFLGALHMDVFMSRLDEEFECPVVCTAPSVPYICQLSFSGAQPDEDDIYIIDSPSKFPNSPADLATIGVSGRKKKKKAKFVSKTEREDVLKWDNAKMVFYETWVSSSIMSTADTLGPLLELISQFKGEQNGITYPSKDRICVNVSFPMSEILFQFHDLLKSVTRGYGSFDFVEEPVKRKVKLTRVDIEINNEPVDALSFLCSTVDAPKKSRDVVKVLAGTMSRQNFAIDVRALIRGKPIARETLKAYRKDVLTKGGKTVGGGDESRKKKLLEKQKAGKKRMKMVGNVELSEKSFLAVMSLPR